ncbi:MAG: hypothetical protein K0R28_1124 [Paenibacillus sp.]|nr:hypothetical protein [Paenibacillus sp.]
MKKYVIMIIILAAAAAILFITIVNFACDLGDAYKQMG